MTETAFAKINLALHVRKRRDDGYHELETIFAFVDDGDRIVASMADDITLDITGPFAGLLSRTDNLVIRVAERMRDHFAISEGAAITLEKRLPVASGIGGGSADAAATARLLNKHWGLNVSAVELQNLLAPLGADIPACVTSETAFGCGTGTQLRPISSEGIGGKAILLVNPMVAVATGAVFARWDGIDRGGLSGTWEGALAGRNDLEPPALAMWPEIGKALELLRGLRGSELVRMSGSGATCFAIFGSIALRDEGLDIIEAQCPDYWKLASVLR